MELLEYEGDRSVTHISVDTKTERKGQRSKKEQRKKNPKKLGHESWQKKFGEIEIEIPSFPLSKPLPPFPTVNHQPVISPPVKSDRQTRWSLRVFPASIFYESKLLTELGKTNKNYVLV